MTRRERIMQEVVRRMDEMQEGQPVADPYRTTFGVVTRGSSLEGVHRTQKAACTVMSTEERKTPKISQVDAFLRVVVEFMSWIGDSEQPDQTLNRVMGDIQRKMREDVHLTEPDDGRPLVERELSFDVEESGNQGFVDGYSDKQVTGAVFWTIKYKHAPNDPREYAGNR